LPLHVRILKQTPSLKYLIAQLGEIFGPASLTSLHLRDVPEVVLDALSKAAQRDVPFLSELA